MRGARAESSAPAGRELRGHAELMAVFASLLAVFGTWFARSGRTLPERVGLGDLALLTLGTHKLARLLAKDRATSVLRAPFVHARGAGGPGEVEETPAGRGLRRAVGELVTCPYCIGMWVASALAGGLLVAPRATRWAAAVLAALTGADVLQILYRRLEDTL